MFNIFKIEYDWYEGEHEETYLGKDIPIEEFEKDLIKAKKFAQSLIGNEIKIGKHYLGKGYTIECLPKYYEQIIWFLEYKLRYIKCDIEKNISYNIDSDNNKIYITKSEKEIKRTKF